jgi:hypothetical protein
MYLCKTSRLETKQEICGKGPCYVVDIFIFNTKSFMSPVDGEDSLGVCVPSAFNRQLENSLKY